MTPEPEGVELRIRVNGEDRVAFVDPQMSLLEVLRERVGLTGSHVGCMTGDCGACTVRINGKIAKSCLLLGAGQQDVDILTIEGIGSADQLHPVQQAFWDEHGFQCGYCLPGMLFSALDLVERIPEPTEGDIRGAIDGCLCRCTGYESIVRSVQAAVERMTCVDTSKRQNDTHGCHPSSAAAPEQEETA